MRPPARRILVGARAARYRRSLTNDDIRRSSASISPRARGDFDAGIRAGLEMVLVSPDFLFRIWRDPAGAAPGTCTPCRMSSSRRACRFSCGAAFPTTNCSTRRSVESCTSQLCSIDKSGACWATSAHARRWSELLRGMAADAKRPADQAGSQPEVSLVRRQPARRLRQGNGVVRRCPAERGSQHRRSADVGPDVSQRTTRAALRRPGRLRKPFPPVTLTDENRFGLLGKAAVLSVTSYSTRTAPTIRGKYLLENILAAPPPPPPSQYTGARGDQQGRQASLGARNARMCIERIRCARAVTREWIRSG